MADIVRYILNDPTTPDLVVDMEIPPKPAQCDFKVDGFRGGADQFNTLEHQAACCQVTLINGINLANRYVKLERWSSVPQLFVEPRAGKQFNAFYDRTGLRFFYSNDPVNRQLVYAVNSSEVVAHEMGHAVLDALRPELFNMQSMEVWGFHEAFGDIHAMINALQHEMNINRVLNDTNADLRQSNSVSRIAEEMGLAIFHVTGGHMGYSAASLRDGVNNFKYIEPETLPGSGPDNILTSECHSFSRVFTGAWYDCFVGIYEEEKKTRQPKEALLIARDTMAEYTFKCLALAPAVVRFYDAVARAILVIDKSNGYKYNQIINDAFMKRGILKELVKPLLSMDWMTFKNTVEPSDEVYETTDAKAVRDKGTDVLPLPQAFLTVTVPGDTFYEFDKNGACVGVIASTPEEVISHATHCVSFLKANDMIRADKQTPFEIDPDGNLVRSHFACGCGGGCGSAIGSAWLHPNCTDPEAPEYLKCWKSENNAGCGCGKRNDNCCDDPANGPRYVRATSLNRVLIPL